MQVNSTCPICKKRFNASHKFIAVSLPCEHYYHKKCLKSVENCVLCEKKCICYKEQHDYSVHDQHYINIMSLERTKYTPSYYDIINAIFYRIPVISYYLLCFWFKPRTYFALQSLLDNVNNVLNINLTLKGDEHLDENKKIYVVNHCSFLDALILPRSIITGAVASVSNINNPFGKLMRECTHIYFVERGKSKNSVKEINDHVDKNGSLLFCPQGLFAHHQTLPLFRTGAFATKFNVQPLLILYKQNVGSLSMFNILCYPRIDVTIKILPTEQKKDNESVQEFTERVRCLMAKSGKLLLSNVSSRDIIDDNVL